MKTVKRHAKVGERILIVEEDEIQNGYRVGSVMKVVKDADSIGGVNAFCHPQTKNEPSYVSYDEYEVITEEDNHAETNEA